MKTIALLLVTATLALAESYQWWSDTAPISYPGAHSVIQEYAQMTVMDSVFVYFETLPTTLCLYHNDTHDQVTMEDETLASSVVQIGDYWKASFYFPYIDNYILVHSDSNIRHSLTTTTHTYWYDGGWQLAWSPLEANIIYTGEGTVALQRETWASIKTSF